MGDKLNLSDYQRYIHKSRYARFIDEKGRREHWEETVDRLVAFYIKKFPEHEAIWKTDLREAIVKMEVMPSMRSLMTAGTALEKDNICGYNCSFLPVNHIKAFSEALYILMCG